MSSTRQSYTCAVLSERLQALVAELREVEKLRSRLRHVEARTLGRRRRAKRRAEQEPFKGPPGLKIEPRWLISRDFVARIIRDHRSALFGRPPPSSSAVARLVAAAELSSASLSSYPQQERRFE